MKKDDAKWAERWFVLMIIIILAATVITFAYFVRYSLDMEEIEQRHIELIESSHQQILMMERFIKKQERFDNLMEQLIKKEQDGYLKMQNLNWNANGRTE